MIAEWLHLSEGTVRNNVSTILAKLQVSDRTQAALLAVQHGLGDVADEHTASSYKQRTYLAYRHTKVATQYERSPTNRRFTLLALMLALFALLVPLALAEGQQSSTPEQVVAKAWELARTSGTYTLPDERRAADRPGAEPAERRSPATPR